MNPTANLTDYYVFKYPPSSAGLNETTRLYICLWLFVIVFIITFFLLWLGLATWQKHKKETESFRRSCSGTGSPLQNDLTCRFLPRTEYAELDDLITHRDLGNGDQYPDRLWRREHDDVTQSEV